MIRGLVDFALNNRLLIVALAILLFGWGIISFKNLPIEAYPDVANNYVQVITQWPGRAAEEVEQQVTIPIEIVMNGLPHLQHLRSTSLFGLSSVMLVFDDESQFRWSMLLFGTAESLKSIETLPLSMGKTKFDHFWCRPGTSSSLRRRRVNTSSRSGLHQR
jgi:Cu/Ag efflux pump CusA